MIFPVFLAALALNQQNEAPDAKLTVEPGAAIAGGLVKATISLTFAPGLHGYQNPPSQDYMIPVEVKSADGASLLAIQYPKGEPALVGGESTPVMTYANTVEIPVILRLPKTSGDLNVSVSIRYQQCNEQSCYPPSTVTAKGKVEVAPMPEGWNAVKRRSHDLLVLINNS